MSRIITMIPVRMASTRLPNKPLLDINGKSLIQRVYENVKACVPGDIVIAAGDQVIVDEANKIGAKAILTDPSLPSGTDRISAALKELDPDGTKYDIVINVTGGGLNGQAAACLHGISRALVQIDPDARTSLKANGYLTRDSRMVERKKYGQRGARRRFQFSKR